VDVSDVKGIVSWLVDRLTDARTTFEAIAVRPTVEHPGRTAGVIAEGPDGRRVALGRVGELDPRYLAAYDVRAERVVFADLDWSALSSLVPSARRAGPLERLPSVERDIAVVVGEDRAAADVERVVRESAGAQLREVRLFDRYQGPPLAERDVSLAFRLRFEPVDRPLGEAELDRIIDGVVIALRGQLGGTLRG
jgi:phenylalanyl-tRNA synthetase beta chain